MCDCLAIIARILISVLSLIFSILGIILVAVGALVKIKYDTIQQYIDPVIEMLKSQAQGALGENAEVPTEEFAALIEDMIGGLAMAFIILGVVMLVVGVMGVAGACCMVKCMIIGYIIVTALMTIGLVIMIIILKVDKDIVTGPPKVELTKTLQQEYMGVNGTDVTSLMWNAIMTWQQCCGVNDHTDFDKAEKWKTRFGANTFLKFEIPATCCKPEYLSQDTLQECTLKTSVNNNKDIGCYDKLVDLLLEGQLFITFACGTTITMGVLTFLAIVILIKIIKKNKVGYS